MIARRGALLVAGVAVITPVFSQTMFRGDAHHSGVYASQAPRSFHRVKWIFTTGDRVVSSPVYADRLIYFGSDDGNVYAVDVTNGHQVWKHRTGGPVAATPAIVGGVAFVGSYDGKFYALNVRTGATKWTFATGGERRFEAQGLHGFKPTTQTIADPFDVFLSSPVVAQGTVYFGSGDGYVYALDAASGSLKWKLRTGDVVHASPAYAEGVVFVGSWDSYFYALNASTGAMKWRFHSGEDSITHNQVGFQSSPAVVDGIVYTGCRDSSLYALDAATGAEKWRFSTGQSWVVSTPAVKDGKVFFATSDSSLFHIVDAATGKSLVQSQAKAYMFSSPALAGDMAVVGLINGSLEARNLSDGALLWTYRTEASRRNAHWVLTAEGELNSAFYTRSSWREAPLVTSVLEYSVGSVYSSPLIVDGIIYFASADGSLYAVE